jgi:peroxiredoxin
VFAPGGAPGDRKRRIIALGIALAVVGAVVAVVLWIRSGGNRAPGGTVTSRKGEQVELSSLWSERRVLVMFYAGFQRSAEELRQLNAFLPQIDATVIAISVDSHVHADRLHDELALDFELYVDPTLAVMKKWDLPFVTASLPSSAEFLVEPGGKISYKRIGEHPPLYQLVDAVRR